MKKTIIETDRLILREFIPEDLDDIYRLYGESDVSFLQPLSEDRQEEREKLKSYIRYSYGFYGVGLWAVCLKESGRLIGRCGLQVIFLNEENEGDYEAGYMISGLYSGMGYGKEAVSGILKYADDELETKRVVVRIDKRNDGSLRFAENLGFRKLAEMDDGCVLMGHIFTSCE